MTLDTLTLDQVLTLSILFCQIIVTVGLLCLLPAGFKAYRDLWANRRIVYRNLRGK